MATLSTTTNPAAQPTRTPWTEPVLFALCVLVALIVFAQHDLLHTPLGHDMSLQMYSAQLIARGLPPYVMVGLVKTPLTSIAGALMILIGNVFGVWDVLAVRFGFWLLMGLGVGGMYLWARALFNSRLAGMVTALTLLSFPLIGSNAVVGPQPKTLMIVAAIYTFYFLGRAKWFWAGVMSALAFLTWQPAAILIGIVLLISLVDPGGKRLPALGRAVGGVTLPILMLVVYLIAEHALSAALQDTFGANLAYLRNSNAQLPLAARFLDNVGKLIQRLRPPGCYDNGVMAGAGLVGLAGAITIPLLRGKPRTLLSPRVLPIFLYTLLFLGFTLVDFQVCNDLIAFAPVLALGIGMLTTLALKWLTPRLPANPAARFGAVSLSVVLYFVATSGPVWTVPQREDIQLDEQVAQVQEISALLAPDDQVQQLGDAVVLVFLKKQNPTKLIFFGPKTGTGILQQIPGGIQTVIRQLQAAPPRIVTFSHIVESDWSRELGRWVETRYTRVGDYELFPGKNSALRVYVRQE
ncbi:MAG: hypothetical protein HY780_11135 [Chloroflexi bacterium]|nr:hypothetical protein [Chloroflexota bacterium]